MKPRFIAPITKLCVVLILVLLPFGAIAKDMPALNEQLISAAGHGDHAKVKSLLDKGADVNAKRDGGWTALMLAARGGHVEVAKTLLDKGADVNANNYAGRQPSAPLSLDQICERTIAMDSYPTYPSLWDNQFFYGSTALMMAANWGHPEVARLLLDNGADVNARNHFGTTALAAAVLKGYLEVTKILLDKEADPNEQDCWGLPILSRAVLRGYPEAVKVLLENGAEVNAKDKNGSTALMMVSSQGHRQVVDLLKAHGAKE
jgi:ankyrin repeat protein